MAFETETYEKLGVFYLGREVGRPTSPILYESRDLTTHAVCVGMTGSGKTGLCVGLLEEALIDGIPVIAIDPKGDLGNLALTFPALRPADFAQWVDGDTDPAQTASRWREGLAQWGQDGERIARLRAAGEVTIYTPGSSAGSGVSLLGSLAAPARATIDDAEAFADRVSSTATSLLALLGIHADPLQSSEHVFLSNLLMHYWRAGAGLDLSTLIGGIQEPPFRRVGVMDVDTVFDARDRTRLAMRMNNLLAAPAFAPWLEGDDLDVAKFLRTDDGRPRASVFSIAHLNDDERMFFVSLLMGRIVDWTRQQSGTRSLRAIVCMDEVYGYMPPVANPPSKAPLLTMLKQARAHGVGVVVATQNPVDLDYKALSNAGTWFIGRLQTAQDVGRVVDGLVSSDAADQLDADDVRTMIGELQPREFFLHNVHEEYVRAFESRWTLSYLRGPMTRADLRLLAEVERGSEAGAAERAETAAPTEERVVSEPVAGDHSGAYLPIRAPGGDDEELVWRPMAYGGGTAKVVDRRKNIDEFVEFGFIRSLKDRTTIDWAQATEVVLAVDDFAERGEPGMHLDVDPAVEGEASWEAWRTDLVRHVARSVPARSWSCKPLRLESEPGESESDFLSRVGQAAREERDEAVEKLRKRWQQKVERLERQLERARDRLARQEDQARDAKLKAAVDVGEALWGLFGGRRNRISTNRATRVVKESRDVERAEQKVDELISDLCDTQAQMEAAMIEESEKFTADRYPIETHEARPDEDDVDVAYCGLVWVPYWVRSDGTRRRAS